MSNPLTPEEQAERQTLKTKTFGYRFGNQDRASWPESVKQDVDRYHALSDRLHKQTPRGKRNETHSVKWRVESSFLGGPYVAQLGNRLLDDRKEAQEDRDFLKKTFGEKVKTRLVRVEITETVAESDPA